MMAQPLLRIGLGASVLLSVVMTAAWRSPAAGAPPNPQAPAAATQTNPASPQPADKKPPLNPHGRRLAIFLEDPPVHPAARRSDDDEVLGQIGGLLRCSRFGEIGGRGGKDTEVDANLPRDCR